MCLRDDDLSIAWRMAKKLKGVGGEYQEVSEIIFFDTIEPFIKRLAKKQIALDLVARDLGYNRVFACFIEDLIFCLSDFWNNDKQELEAIAKSRYPDAEWSDEYSW